MVLIYWMCDGGYTLWLHWLLFLSLSLNILLWWDDPCYLCGIFLSDLTL
jgi:hypothetical protein